MKQILPGLAKVGTINKTSLPNNITYKAISGIKIYIPENNIEWLDIVGDNTAQAEEKFDNNSIYESAKINFTATQNISYYPLKAFVVVTVENEAYLIGADNKIPVIHMKSSSGVPSGENAAYGYEIDFSAKKALVKVILT